MTVLEVALVPYKQTLTKEALDNAWKGPEKHLKEAHGCKAIYTGLMPTHPGFLCVVIVWESIHAHHKFQHGPTYKPFIVRALPILAGDIEVANFELPHNHTDVKKALESPCTQISHLSIKKGSVYDFLKAYNEAFEKHVAGEKYTAMWTSYPYEEPFSFYAFLGWQNEQDHYDVMKKDSYSEFRASFKDCIAEKGVKIYHALLTKVYGDW